MITYISNRVLLFAIFIVIVLLYISFTLKSCLLPKLRQTFHEVGVTSSIIRAFQLLRVSFSVVTLKHSTKLHRNRISHGVHLMQAKSLRLN